jgi:chromatin remodeling complex protein RSC6
MSSLKEEIEVISDSSGVSEQEESPETPRSKLEEIWSYYKTQLDRIDDLEQRLDEQATRSRRRVTNILDQTPAHRMSHLRMFLTHIYANTLPNQSKWTLVIEGKLLIGLLDYKSAAKVENEGPISSLPTSDNFKKDDSSYMPNAADAKTGSSSNENTLAEATSRGQYRTVGEKEEDPVEPVFFTHFFDKMEVIFQTIYQPKSPPRPSLSPPKKSRSTKRKAEKQDSSSISPRDLRASDPTKIVWTKNISADANAFFVNYSDHYSERPTPPGMKYHSVVATITLHPTRPVDAIFYTPSPALARKFFPRHQNNSRKQSNDQKRKKTDGSASNEQEESPPIALDNDILLPSLLTMKEITTALYLYIKDKNLQDSNEKSNILLDKSLSDLFECETMNFSELQQALISKNLITKVGPEEQPIVLTYIMKKDTTSPQHPPGAVPESDTKDPSHHHQVLSFDMDVAVPSFFHYRSRELLRRIKRREFEYTSSRTKARYLLVASRANEDIVKTKIEQTISGQGYAADNIPVFLALAKAAPPNSEARIAAQIDAKTCALVGRLEECSRQAEASWELVEACTTMTSDK